MKGYYDPNGEQGQNKDGVNSVEREAKQLKKWLGMSRPAVVL